MDYKSKAKDSFKTKLNLYIFNKVLSCSNNINQKDFEDFKITPDLIKLYTTIYWQEFREFPIHGKIIGDIEKDIIKIEISQRNLIQSLQKNYIDNFEKVFPKKDFDEIVNQKACYYCKITKAQIEKLGTKHKLNKKNLRGWSLELDRLNSNDEYKKDNCVMACYWCNNAKTDEFTPEEFLKVAERIHDVWMERLNDN